MYPSFQRFPSSTAARPLHGAGVAGHAADGDDGEEEDAREVVRSLQPLPSSARLMGGAHAMVRELQARVGPQYLPSPVQQQHIQQFQLQQQQQFQHMQQQQRRGRGAPVQQMPPPPQYFNMDQGNGGWPPSTLMADMADAACYKAQFV